MNLETYLATHKALVDTHGSASKRHDDAQIAEVEAIMSGKEHALIEDLHKQVSAAGQERDDASRNLEALKKWYPDLEEKREDLELQRKHDEQLRKEDETKAAKEERTEKVLAVITDGDNVRAVVKGIEVVAEAVGIPTPNPPISDSIPSGDLRVHVKDKLEPYVERGKEIIDGPSDTKVEARFTAPEPETQTRNAAQRHQELPEPGLHSQYLSDVATGIASGAGYIESELNASANLHRTLTGKTYDKPEGLHQAVANELEAKFGEASKQVYEESQKALIELDRQRTAGLDGWAR